MVTSRRTQHRVDVSTEHWLPDPPPQTPPKGLDGLSIFKEPPTTLLRDPLHAAKPVTTKLLSVFVDYQVSVAIRSIVEPDAPLVAWIAVPVLRR
jgi:hypothetical protein